jgi:hypothetical protein
MCCMHSWLENTRNGSCVVCIHGLKTLEWVHVLYAFMAVSTQQLVHVLYAFMALIHNSLFMCCMHSWLENTKTGSYVVCIHGYKPLELVHVLYVFMARKH